jgi:aminoglycoside phosphotransferase (APT) family kinase protein
MPPRFSLRELPGPPPAIEKRGDPEALAREAAALRLLAGRPVAPALVSHDPGVLVSERLPGEPRPLAALAPPDLRRLGRVLAEVHDVRRTRSGGLPRWRVPASSLADYRRLRAEDTERALRGRPEAGLARRAAAVPAPPEPAGAPFRLLHGDLVEANVVWGPEGPALVDWEFSRMGDPAEDLAYLAETNALPPARLAALLEGYGEPGMAERLDAWRALVALDAGAWYLREGSGQRAAALLARGRSLASEVAGS